MISLGVMLIQSFNWVLYVLGAFLVVTGVRILFGGGKVAHPEDTFTSRFAQKYFSANGGSVGTEFISWRLGRFALSPLLLVLALVEVTDLSFAVDSISAVFAVTTKPFIVFTSNVFAVLGLRSLYFVLVVAGIFFDFRRAVRQRRTAGKEKMDCRLHGSHRWNRFPGLNHFGF
jgi:tellurite resistance protein TerC